MKTTLFLLAWTLLSCLMVNHARAEVPILFLCQAEDAHQLQVQLANLMQKPTQVTLETENGRILFREAVLQHNGYLQKLDLRKLEAGTYVLRIWQEGEEVIQKVEVHADGLTLSSPVYRTGTEEHQRQRGSGLGT